MGVSMRSIDARIMAWDVLRKRALSCFYRVWRRHCDASWAEAQLKTGVTLRWTCQDAGGGFGGMYGKRD